MHVFPSQQGDVISIISMNETGMWRGMVGHRIGTFKFINVEMLPADSPQPSPIKRQPRMRGPRRPRPRTVHELLLRLGLSVRPLLMFCSCVRAFCRQRRGRRQILLQIKYPTFDIIHFPVRTLPTAFLW